MPDTNLNLGFIFDLSHNLADDTGILLSGCLISHYDIQKVLGFRQK